MMKKRLTFSALDYPQKDHTLKTIVLSTYNIGFSGKVLLIQVQHCPFLEEVSALYTRIEFFL